MKKTVHFGVIVALIGSVQTSHAAINKCVVDGKTTYTQEPCPANSQQELNTSGFNLSSRSMESISANFTNTLNWINSSSASGPEITKFKEPYADINPTVSSAVYGGPFGSPESYFKEIISHVRQKDKSMQVIGNISETIIAGKKSFNLKIKATYLLSGKAYPVVAEYWAIPRGNRAFFVIYSASQKNSEENRAEALKIINSLEFK